MHERISNLHKVLNQISSCPRNKYCRTSWDAGWRRRGEGEGLCSGRRVQADPAPRGQTVALLRRPGLRPQVHFQLRLLLMPIVEDAAHGCSKCVGILLLPLFEMLRENGYLTTINKLLTHCRLRNLLQLIDHFSHW